MPAKFNHDILPLSAKAVARSHWDTMPPILDQLFKDITAAVQRAADRAAQIDEMKAASRLSLDTTGTFTLRDDAPQHFEKTNWFNTKHYTPYHAGVYEVAIDLDRGYFSYWNGTQWGEIHPSAWDAAVYRYYKLQDQGLITHFRGLRNPA